MRQQTYSLIFVSYVLNLEFEIDTYFQKELQLYKQEGFSKRKTLLTWLEFAIDHEGQRLRVEQVIAQKMSVIPYCSPCGEPKQHNFCQGRRALSAVSAHTPLNQSNKNKFFSSFNIFYKFKQINKNTLKTQQNKTLKKLNQTQNKKKSKYELFIYLQNTEKNLILKVLKTKKMLELFKYNSVLVNCIQFLISIIIYYLHIKSKYSFNFNFQIVYKKFLSSKYCISKRKQKPSQLILTVFNK
ncbi:transmembrane protein, putative (macronuclear) [Tetrahymena thermophila SB210]|uniref:Transmembrane protein, putative n=1 Tax=Tetrahymena thermophila (strain SB210) TaxID=312017 RepID=A4VDY6_TETTS|nr:transmembrane protein, putative [Tetrahymena thermophila SB210]EDK31733.2 transmembrane protein, putative [Tetrahymena thermophila SB210]|eukprot:XP_001471340.2 transmembrane protein, putative [Tetrahymena thermophila SB210]